MRHDEAVPWWRRVPLDAIALLAIAFVIIVSHVPFTRHGMCFNDPSWYFHFGRRVLAGDVPYRDFVFQVGPLPIYVDAAFQSIFGDRYLASVYAGVGLELLRVFVVWLIVRRVAGLAAAAGLAIFCIFDPVFAFTHHWSSGYAQLFITASGLFLVLASRADGRRALVHLAVAGLFAGLVVSARQSTAALIGLAMFPATLILLARKEYFTTRRFLALWGGFAAGLAIVFGALAVAGALGPAIQQMFLDAPQKKSVSGAAALADAISGGALIDPVGSWWGGALRYLALPATVVLAIVWFARSDKPASLAAVGRLAVPVAIVVGVATRYATLNLYTDLPRTLLTVITAIAVLWPARSRAWFGLEPLVAIGLGGLALVADWALEMSLPGRGWGDATSLMVGVILVALASTRLSVRAKTALAAAFAIAATLQFVVALRRGEHPVAKFEAADGTLRETIVPVDNRVMRGMLVDAARARIVAWLSAEVPRGSTCFIYGNMPVVYDVLACTNPTRIDTTAADFITAEDARRASDVLRQNPPDFIIAQDRQWMNAPLSLDLGGQVERYEGINKPASMAMHLGVRAILDQYEPVRTAVDVLTPQQLEAARRHWDVIDSVRLYRRRR